MTVVVEQQGQVLFIRLARPEKRNAVDREMALQLDQAMRTLEETPAVRVGVLAATGPVFCAGTDMSDPRDKHTPDGGEYGMLRRERSKPLVAAVEGPAVGGGFEIVLACELVVASTAATFSLPETRRGLVATSGGLFRSHRSLPYHVAAELLLTGNSVDAARAYALGLATAVVEPGRAEARAVELATDVARGGPVAVAATMRALREVTAAQDEIGWQATARARETVHDGAEAAEGKRAFFERRRPSWDRTGDEHTGEGRT